MGQPPLADQVFPAFQLVLIDQDNLGLHADLIDLEHLALLVVLWVPLVLEVLRALSLAAVKLFSLYRDAASTKHQQNVQTRCIPQ